MTGGNITTVVCWGAAIGFIAYNGLDIGGWLERRRLRRRAESWNEALDQVQPPQDLLADYRAQQIAIACADPDGWEWDWDDPPPIARTVEELDALLNVPWPRGRTFH